MKIYVGNLNFDTTETALRDAFGQHGDVEEVAIITDRDTGRSRGFAFVTMPDDGQAQAAIDALNGTEVDFDDKLVGGGFVFNNPNAKGRCGCGASFRT